jgi:metal-responsive CopG/Arc/MetJ family transcriptional regulator
MEIISVSLDDETLSELARAQKSMGFKSRSKLLRAAMNALIEERVRLDGIEGHADAVFTVAYEFRKKDQLGILIKEYEDIVRTEIHQHHEGTCLRVLILCGEGSMLRDFASALRRENGVRSLNIAIL